MVAKLNLSLDDKIGNDINSGICYSIRHFGCNSVSHFEAPSLEQYNLYLRYWGAKAYVGNLIIKYSNLPTVNLSFITGMRFPGNMEKPFTYKFGSPYGEVDKIVYCLFYGENGFGPIYVPASCCCNNVICVSEINNNSSMVFIGSTCIWKGNIFGGNNSEFTTPGQTLVVTSDQTQFVTSNLIVVGVIHGAICGAIKNMSNYINVMVSNGFMVKRTS